MQFEVACYMYIHMYVVHLYTCDILYSGIFFRSAKFL